jgi:FKBP-type peptidyl-prolyl cis-trans isomerase
MIKKNINAVLIACIIVLTASLVSCNSSKKYEKDEEQSIQSFLAKNPTKNYQLQPSGLYYLEVLKGTGISPVMGDSVYIKYTLTFLDGTLIDSNTTGSGYKMVLDEYIIPGFTEGLTLMAEGGKASLVIPSKLGYGPNGVRDYYGRTIIPGYAALLYELELVKVIPKAVK